MWSAEKTDRERRQGKKGFKSAEKTDPTSDGGKSKWMNQQMKRRWVLEVKRGGERGGLDFRNFEGEERTKRRQE